MNKAMDQIENAAKAYAEFLRSIGLSKENSGIDIEDSARKTARLMSTWMRGVSQERPSLERMPNPGRQSVVLKSIPFYSFCGHHFVPFFGTAEISYIPDEWIAGLGWFSRVVDYYARRPQFQENLCAQIAEHIDADLSPCEVTVTLRTRQMCLELHENCAGVEIETVKRIVKE